MDLADVVKEKQARIHTYGVILDCSAPYFHEGLSKYLCTLKLIDESLDKTKGKYELVNTTVFANASGDIPKPTKIGSIFRIHRGDTKLIKGSGVIQLNCDCNIKAAWCLFDPTESESPIAHTGHRFTWEAKDIERLKAIRAFAKKYFAKKEINFVTLKDGMKNKKEFDTIGRIWDAKEKDSMNQYKLFDGEKMVTLEVPVKRYDYLAPQDTVKIRSAFYKDKDCKVVGVQEWSSIIRIPKEYKAAMDLSKLILNARKSDDHKLEVDMYTPSLDEPKNVSEILGNQKLKEVQLEKLFSAGLKGNKKFKIKVSAIEAGPKNVRDWICVVDKKTQKQ